MIIDSTIENINSIVIRPYFFKAIHNSKKKLLYYDIYFIKYLCFLYIALDEPHTQ